MPFGDEGVEGNWIGLALSGGGFRASLFHTGVLWRLNEMGILSKLDRISSVSGGSITAGVLGMNWSRLDFHKDVARGFQAQVVEPILRFTKLKIDTPSILKGLLTPGRTVAQVVATQYRKHLFGDSGLQALPDRPRFIFNATNLGTGSNWRFQKAYCGDYKIGLIHNANFPLATAVAASAAFPPVLSPIVLDVKPESFEKTNGAYLYDQIDLRMQISLADGGVYDNMGLEAIWKRCGALLVSDAGGSPSMEFGPKPLWHNQLNRAYSLTIEQDRDLRRRVLYDAYTSTDDKEKRRGAYWLISWPVEKFHKANPMPVAAGWATKLGEMRTRLNPFSDDEQRWLINWGYALADGAVRRRFENSTFPADWPFPSHALVAT